MVDLARKAKANFKEQSGFTFIELMVVMVLISVMLAVAGPSLGRFYKGVKLDSSARQLRMFLMYAQEVSISENKIYRINIASGWRKLSLLVQGEPEKNPDKFVDAVARFQVLNIVDNVFIKNIDKSDGDVSSNSAFFIDIHPIFSEQEVSFFLEDVDGNSAVVKRRAGGGSVTIVRKQGGS